MGERLDVLDREDATRGLGGTQRVGAGGLGETAAEEGKGDGGRVENPSPMHVTVTLAS